MRASTHHSQENDQDKQTIKLDLQPYNYQKPGPEQFLLLNENGISDEMRNWMQCWPYLSNLLMVWGYTLDPSNHLMSSTPLHTSFSHHKPLSTLFDHHQIHPTSSHDAEKQLKVEDEEEEDAFTSLPYTTITQLSLMLSLKPNHRVDKLPRTLQVFHFYSNDHKSMGVKFVQQVHEHIINTVNTMNNSDIPISYDHLIVTNVNLSAPAIRLMNQYSCTYECRATWINTNELRYNVLQHVWNPFEISLQMNSTQLLSQLDLSIEQLPLVHGPLVRCLDLKPDQIIQITQSTPTPHTTFRRVMNHNNNDDDGAY